MIEDIHPFRSAYALKLSLTEGHTEIILKERFGARDLEGRA